jgi:hypothetical protein
MQKSGLIIVLVSIIVILLLILVYGVYTGFKVKAEIKTLETEKSQLIDDRNQCDMEVQSLNSDLSMLREDVAKIYRGCILENACKGRSPGVRWYCNNVGDEVSDPSHVCICDASCRLNATQIT